MIEKNKDWNGHCSCIGCYWNMWFPIQYKNIDYSTEDSKVCVSESLDEIKMSPNKESCPGFLSFKKFVGCDKGETRNGFV